MTQLAITVKDNKNLFSNYYLDNQIKNNPEWKKEEEPLTCFILPTKDLKLGWYYLSRIVSKLQGGAYEMQSIYLARFPIRRISFTTTPDRCAALVAKAKALYSEYLGAPDADNFDGINRIDRINDSNPVNPVQTVASQSAAPDSQKILEFVGAPFEELTNKTAIKEYYEAGFNALAGALAKNKKKLKEGYDPTRREPKEKLQEEFNDPVGKLAPLLKKIEATDRLIDQIVYKLYGLTEDEIKIVEESISGGKDL